MLTLACPAKVAFFSIRFEAIRDQLLFFPRKKKEELRSLFPKLFQMRCQVFARLLKQENRALAFLPESIDDYRTLVEDIVRNENMREVHVSHLSEILQLFASFEIFSLVPTHEDRALLEAVQLEHTKFGTSLDLSRSSLQRRVRSAEGLLEDWFSSLTLNYKKLIECLRSLGGGQRDDREMPVEKAKVYLLLEVQDQIKTLEEEAFRFYEYQDFFHSFSLNGDKDLLKFTSPTLNELKMSVTKRLQQCPRE